MKLRKLILRLTSHLWNKEIDRLLYAAQKEGIINRRTFHELSEWFDPKLRIIEYGKT